MSQKRRLVYLINSLDVGGAQIGMCRLLNGIAESDFDITVVSLTAGSCELFNLIPSEVRVVTLYGRDGSLLNSSLIVLEKLRKADVIVGSLFHSVIFARVLSVINPSATVATWQHSNQFTSVVREELFRRTIRFTNVVLADSEAVAKMLIDELEIDESVVHSVPIAGINLSEYTEVTHRDTDDIRVGTVGRLTKAKNYEMVLDVAENMLESGVTFDIAGDGEQYEKLQLMIEDRELTNVVLHGQVDDVPTFLSTLDIYLQPSLREGLCISVLEAMASRLPVVGSNVGGIKRNVDHQTSGFLHDPSDTKAYVSSIRTLAGNPHLRSRFGANGRRTVKQNFTRDHLVSAFISAIE
ncbi:glycosyltransferase family 4 protein [Halorubrum sp. T3]|uniref:glycosyltransferase family 4 protein n=1 Tax=Halorubrum sp. T3 TaxID=1194088 RepID=UPI0009E4E38D|nr:glycosyltransferase family 4 protein [Halorubrum sp. T3]